MSALAEEHDADDEQDEHPEDFVLAIALDELGDALDEHQHQRASQIPPHRWHSHKPLCEYPRTGVANGPSTVAMTAIRAILISTALSLLTTPAIGSRSERAVSHGTTRTGALLHVPAAYRTIREAIESASPGDTIRVGPGRYPFGFAISEKALIIESTDGAAQTTIAGIIQISSVRTGTVVIRGFTLEGPTVLGALSARDAALRFEGNEVVNHDNAIQVSEMRECAILFNRITDVGTAIDVRQSDGCIIEGNTIRRSRRAAIVVNGSQNVTVQNNVLWESESAGIDLSQIGVPSGALIRHNTIVQSRGPAIQLSLVTNGSAVAIENNILIGDELGGPAVRCMAIFQPGPDLFHFGANVVTVRAGPPVDRGCQEDDFGVLLQVDPLFVDSAHGDFGPDVGSPAIDAGLPLTPSVSIDGIGNVRPIDGDGNGTVEPDLGYLELNPYTPTRTPPPTPPPSPTGTPTPPCSGDCNEDRKVSIAELVAAVRALLQPTKVTPCRAVDSNNDSTVTVSEIVTAVRAALNGCD